MHCFFKYGLTYCVMVAQQILVLSVQVRILVGQLDKYSKQVKAIQNLDFEWLLILGYPKLIKTFQIYRDIVENLRIHVELYYRFYILRKAREF